MGHTGKSGHGLELGLTGVMLGSNRVLVKVGAGRFDGVGAGLE